MCAFPYPRLAVSSETLALSMSIMVSDGTSAMPYGYGINQKADRGATLTGWWAWNAVVDPFFLDIPS